MKKETLKENLKVAGIFAGTVTATMILPDLAQAALDSASMDNSIGNVIEWMRGKPSDAIFVVGLTAAGYLASTGKIVPGGLTALGATAYTIVMKTMI